MVISTQRIIKEVPRERLEAIAVRLAKWTRSEHHSKVEGADIAAQLGKLIEHVVLSLPSEDEPSHEQVGNALCSLLVFHTNTALNYRPQECHS